MKRLFYTFLILLFVAVTARGQNNVGINDDNSSPKASAMLDVFSASKGLLIPRIALTATTTAAPVTAPEASLLIYNTATAGDVTPGYYYWNGSSKWIRLVTGSDPRQTFNVASKSASTTLLKTESMVFASGNITLTLPVVTSTDDGLEITVKNVGSYTDLIKVLPQSTKKIDGFDSSRLTRWIGRTFVARGTNWYIKDKETRTDNLIEVSTTASFQSIAEAVAFLNLHMIGPTLVRLGGGSFTINATQTINLPYPVTFQGISYGETILTAGAGVLGSPMFNCVSEAYFKMLIFETSSGTSGNDALRLTGTDSYYEIKDCVFTGFNKGIVSTTSNEQWIFENDFEDCAGAAIEIAAGSGTGGTTRISETDFFQCARGVNLLSGAAWTFSLTNANFYNTAAGSDIGIFYNPTNFTNFTSIIITNNGWNNAGTFISGFDFARTDGRDANAIIEWNHGIESKNPHFSINVLNNTATTTLTTTNSWYKCNWTNTSSLPCNWLIVNNKATYLPVNKKDVVIWISGSLSVNTTSTRTISVAIVRNGVTTTRYGQTNLRLPSNNANQPFQFSTVVYLEDVSPGDYFELYASSANANDVLTIRNLNWFSDSK